MIALFNLFTNLIDKILSPPNLKKSSLIPILSSEIPRTSDQILNTLHSALEEELSLPPNDQLPNNASGNISTDDLVYMSYDTTYVDWFDGMAVPIVNGSSYSREDGEVNTMIAPVRIMRYDTITIFTAWWDEWRTEQTEGDPIYIVLD
mgnify:CR=1 FL=1